jgi:hypothetical protein
MPLTLTTRGPKQGRCNICGAVGPLTDDHTPPKGCVRPTGMTLQHVTSRLAAGPAITAKANNGVKYRTLCARCNNDFLGGRYDPALIDFVNRVAGLLASNLSLPSKMTIPAKPGRIVRAVWGHLAAVGVDRYLKGPDTEALRDFFFDESLPVPTSINVYYWVYPYRRQVLIRDAGIIDMHGPMRATYWLMKFYPMAFAVWRPEGSYPLGFRDLAALCTSAPDAVVDVEVELARLPPELWLEAPTSTQGIMYGRDSVVATRRPPRGLILRV